MNIILKDKFEQLLIKNWATFIDYKRLIAYLLECARDTDFPVIQQKNLQVKGTQLKISRFQPEENGFIVWVEFSILVSNTEVIVGTTELFLATSGEASVKQTVGNRFIDGN